MSMMTQRRIRLRKMRLYDLPGFPSESKFNPKTRSAFRFFKDNPLALVGALALGAAAILARVYCMHTAGTVVLNWICSREFSISI